MKCLKCSKNSLYKERIGGKCSGCGQEFVFEPKRGDVFTDTGFNKALELVSDKGSLSWQPRQLFYELARMRMKRPGAVASKLGATIGVGFFGLFLGIFWTIFWSGLFRQRAGFWVAEAVYLLVWAGILTWVWKKTDPTLLTLKTADFDKGLSSWKRVYTLPTGLMNRPQALPKARASEKDVLDYDVERAIVCDHQEVVDFLLANNFHIEQKCAILTYGGYPPDSFEAVRQMLRRNPQLNVFVLHNASANGCRIYQDLTSSREWFPGSKRVFDIGLHPRHAKAFKGQWQKATNHQIQPIPGLSPEELKWLERYKLDLMAVRPQALLNRLRNVLNGHARTLADAYASGDSDGGVDIMLVSASFGGGDDDFG
ncbi:MAG: hypothetical protein CVV27_16405 [Candidatus Melainabacteria bacterium HGW-Melainabacteria-1]|nr:MAG: hypothetical protein CVV27_16405 [Candidatus Melainabacteria bacterium HGW-Melainabacteria-1]